MRRERKLRVENLGELWAVLLSLLASFLVLVDVVLHDVHRHHHHHLYSLLSLVLLLLFLCLLSSLFVCLFVWETRKCQNGDEETDEKLEQFLLRTVFVAVIVVLGKSVSVSVVA